MTPNNENTKIYEIKINEILNIDITICIVYKMILTYTKWLQIYQCKMVDQLQVEVVLEELKPVALADFCSHADPQMKFLKKKLGIIVK